MEVLATSDLLRDVNQMHTAYFPTDVMLYFEKHHIFEIIFDLSILLDRKRPEDVHQFIADNIRKIAEKYRKISVFVNCPPNIELEKFVKVSSRVQRSPVIQVVRPKSKRSLKKLPAQLKRFGLQDKNIVFIAKGKDSTEMEGFISREFHLNRNISIPQEDDTKNFAKDLLPVAMYLRNTLKQLEQRPNHEKMKYVERIVIIGRPGSGKHRQARLLADSLDLVLISVNDLVDNARRDKNYFRNTLEIGFEDNVHTSELITSMVQKRILDPDCLRLGWVLVDYPNTAEDVDNLFSLLVIPQKVILLHTNERLCWKRKTKQEKFERDEQKDQQFKETVLKAEFDFYDLHKTQLNDALERHNCIVIDVNGNRSATKVHADILTKLLTVQHSV
ncbi:adenylate kinase 8 [Culex pipiens pallens]|uniref:adenylate kinase 8 n=1 Tax=Culex pipiens pallens TaxID=42434 RepID=UPI0022AAE736|nr:adenylate kinase 8 [Culex pipiens pallens]